MTSKQLKMEDFTDDYINDATGDIFNDNTSSDYEVPSHHHDEIIITSDMIDRRKDIKDAVVKAFGQAAPEATQHLSSEDIANLLNMDVNVRNSIIEVLYELTDCLEEEGEPTYYPSINDYTDAEEIMTIRSIGGFREDHEEIPHKYSHLKPENVAMIYRNPAIRSVISKMSHITDEFVERNAVI